MTDTIQSSVTLTADGDPVIKMVNQVNSVLEKMGQVADHVNKQFEQLNNTMAKGKAGNALEKQAKSIKKNSDELSKYVTQSQLAAQHESMLANAWNTSSRVIDNRYLKSLKTMKEGLAKVSREFETVQTYHNGYRKSMNDIDMAHARFMIKGNLITRTLDNIATKWINVGKNAQWTGRQLMVGVTAPLLAIGATSIKTAAEIGEVDLVLRRVLSTASSGDLKKLDDQTRQLSETYGVTRKSVKEMQSEFARVGFTIEQVTKATQQASEFAILGKVDTAQAERLVQILYQTGSTYEEVTDQLQKFLLMDQKTNMNIKDTTAAMADIYPTAKRFGASMSEIAAFMAGITQGGIEASDAARVLNFALNKTSTALANMAQGDSGGRARLKNLQEQLKATSELTGVNISLFDKFGQMKKATALYSELGLIWDKLGKINTQKSIALKQQLLNSLFGNENSTQGSQFFDALSKSLNQSTVEGQDLAKAMNIATQQVGAFAQEWTKQLGIIEGDDVVKFQGLLQKLVNTGQDIGKKLLPYLVTALTKVSQLIDRFDALPDSTKKIFLSIAVGLAAIGPMIYASGQAVILLGSLFKGLVAPAKSFFNLILKRDDTFTWTKRLSDSITQLQYDFRKGDIDAKKFGEGLDGIFAEAKNAAKATEELKVVTEASSIASEASAAAITSEAVAKEHLAAANVAAAASEARLADEQRISTAAAAKSAFMSRIKPPPFIPPAGPAHIDILTDKIAEQMRAEMSVPVVSRSIPYGRRARGGALSRTMSKSEDVLRVLNGGDAKSIEKIAEEAAKADFPLKGNDLADDIAYFKSMQDEMNAFHQAWGMHAPIGVDKALYMRSPKEAMLEYYRGFYLFNTKLNEAIGMMAGQTTHLNPDIIIRELRRHPKDVYQLFNDVLNMANMGGITPPPSFTAHSTMNEAAKEIIRTRQTVADEMGMPLPFVQSMSKDVVTSMGMSSGQVEFYGRDRYDPAPKKGKNKGIRKRRLTKIERAEIAAQNAFQQFRAGISGWHPPMAIGELRDIDMLDPWAALLTSKGALGEGGKLITSIGAGNLERAKTENGKIPPFKLLRLVTNELAAREADSAGKMLADIDWLLGLADDDPSKPDKGTIQQLELQKRRLQGALAKFKDASIDVNKSIHLGFVPSNEMMAELRRNKSIIDRVKATLKDMAGGAARESYLDPVADMFEFEPELANLFDDKGNLKRATPNLGELNGVTRGDANSSSGVMRRPARRVLTSSGKKPRSVTASLSTTLRNTAMGQLFTKLNGDKDKRAAEGLAWLEKSFLRPKGIPAKGDSKSTAGKIRKNLAKFIAQAYEMDNPIDLAMAEGMPDAIKVALAHVLYTGKTGSAVMGDKAWLELMEDADRQKMAVIVERLSADVLDQYTSVAKISNGVLPEVSPYHANQARIRAAAIKNRIEGKTGEALIDTTLTGGALSSASTGVDTTGIVEDATRVARENESELKEAQEGLARVETRHKAAVDRITSGIKQTKEDIRAVGRRALVKAEDSEKLVPKNKSRFFRAIERLHEGKADTQRIPEYGRRMAAPYKDMWGLPDELFQQGILTSGTPVPNDDSLYPEGFDPAFITEMQEEATAKLVKLEDELANEEVRYINARAKFDDKITQFTRGARRAKKRGAAKAAKAATSEEYTVPFLKHTGVNAVIDRMMVEAEAEVADLDAVESKYREAQQKIRSLEGRKKRLGDKILDAVKEARVARAAKDALPDKIAAYKKLGAKPEALERMTQKAEAELMEKAAQVTSLQDELATTLAELSDTQTMFGELESKLTSYTNRKPKRQPRARLQRLRTAKFHASLQGRPAPEDSGSLRVYDEKTKKWKDNPDYLKPLAPPRVAERVAATTVAATTPELVQAVEQAIVPSESDNLPAIVEQVQQSRPRPKKLSDPKRTADESFAFWNESPQRQMHWLEEFADELKHDYGLSEKEALEFLNNVDAGEMVAAGYEPTLGSDITREMALSSNEDLMMNLLGPESMEEVDPIYQDYYEEMRKKLEARKAKLGAIETTVVSKALNDAGPAPRLELPSGVIEKAAETTQANFGDDLLAMQSVFMGKRGKALKTPKLSNATGKLSPGLAAAVENMLVGNVTQFKDAAAIIDELVPNLPEELKKEYTELALRLSQAFGANLDEAEKIFGDVLEHEIDAKTGVKKTRRRTLRQRIADRSKDKEMGRFSSKYKRVSTYDNLTSTRELPKDRRQLFDPQSPEIADQLFFSNIGDYRDDGYEESVPHAVMQQSEEGEPQKFESRARGYSEAQVEMMRASVTDSKDILKSLEDELAKLNLEQEAILATHNENVIRAAAEHKARLEAQAAEARAKYYAAKGSYDSLFTDVLDVTDAQGATKRYNSKAEYEAAMNALNAKAREEAAKQLEDPGPRPIRTMVGSKPNGGQTFDEYWDSVDEHKVAVDEWEKKKNAFDDLKSKLDAEALEAAEKHRLANAEVFAKKMEGLHERYEKNIEKISKKKRWKSLLGLKQSPELTDNQREKLADLHTQSFFSGDESDDRSFSRRGIKRAMSTKPTRRAKLRGSIIGAISNYTDRDTSERFSRARLVGRGIGKAADVSHLKEGASVLNKMVNPLRQGQGMVSMWKGFNTYVGEFVAKGGKAHAIMQGMFGKEIAGAMSTSITTVTPFLPIIILLAAVVLILWKNFKKWIDYARPGIKELKEALSNLWHAVVDPFIDVFKRLGDAGGESGNMWKSIGKIIGFVSSAFALAIRAITPFISIVTNYLANALYIIIQIIRIVVDVLTLDFADAWKGVKEVFKTVWDEMKNLAGNAVIAIVGVLFNLVKGAMDAMLNIAIYGSKILSFFGVDGPEKKLKEWKNSADEAIDSLKKGIQDSIWDTITENRKAAQAGKKAGEATIAGMQDGINAQKLDLYGALPTPEEQDAAADEATKDFINSFKSKLEAIVDGWKSAALAAFDDWAKQQTDAIDEKVAAIDKEIEAERKRDEDLDYLRRKEEIREKRRELNTKYRADRALAIYEGRFDDAKQMDYDHGQSLKDLRKEDVQLDEDRTKTLVQRERDAQKERLDIEKKALEESIQAQRNALEAQLNAFTEYLPRNKEAAAAMQQGILGILGQYTGGYTTIGKENAAAWGKAWGTAMDEAKKQVEDDNFWKNLGGEALKEFADAIGVTLDNPDFNMTPGNGDVYGDEIAAAGGSVDSLFPPKRTGFTVNSFPDNPNKYHTGGTVMGAPGEVDATLLSGEYVMQRSAVSKYGQNMLDALNTGKLKFHSGGIVPVLAAGIKNVFGKFVRGFVNGSIGMALNGEDGSSATVTADKMKQALYEAANPVMSSLNIGGIVPSFMSAFNAFNAALGNKFGIVSGFRTHQQQAELYAKFLAGTGNLAAPPGTSMHEFGLAMDTSPNSTASDRELASRYGLVFPISSEPWHVEPVNAKAMKESLAAGMSNFQNTYSTLGFAIKDGIVIPNVPSLDVGGMIRKSGIAEVHKGERVLTAAETAAYGRGGAQIHVHIDGNFFGTDREIEKLVTRIDKEITPKLNKIKGTQSRTFSKVTH